MKIEKFLKVKEYMVYFLVFLIFMGPNFCTFNIRLNFNIGRISLLLLSLFLLIRFFLDIRRKKNLKYQSNNLIKFVLMFFLFWSLYSIISILWVKDIVGWIQITFYIVFGTLSGIYIFLFVDNEKKGYVINCSIVLAILVNVIIAYYQFYLMKKNFSGFYGNVNDLATVLLLGLALVLNLYLKSENKLKYGYLLIAFVFLLSIKFTSSRAIELGIVLGIIFLFNHTYKLIDDLMRNKKILFVLLLLFLIILNFIIYYKLVPIDLPQSSNQIRINLIFNSIFIYLKSPFLGVGAGNIPYYIEKYAIFNTQFGSWHITQAHNMWLEILVSFGPIIFVLFLIIYLKIIVAFIKNKELLFENKGFVFFLFAFIVGSISSSNNISKEWFVIMFILMLLPFKKYNQKKEVN